MKYPIEFYKNLKIGQVIYGINFRDKIEKYTIKRIEFVETIDENGTTIELYKIRTKGGEKQDFNEDFDQNSSIYLTKNDILFEIFGHSEHSVDVVRLETTLHSLCAHPDYEYYTTSGPRKNWNVDKPDGEGWEENGFERFDYHEEAYWRRKKNEVNQYEIKS